MKTYTLPRSGDAPLRIKARLIAQASGATASKKELVRWHEIEVYDLGDGRLAVHVGYRTNWEGELPYDVSTVVNSPDGVRDAIKAFRPLPEARGFPPVPYFAVRQAALERDLRAAFDNVTSQVLSNELFAVSADEEQEERADATARDWLDHFTEIELANFSLTAGEAGAIAEALDGIGDPEPWDALTGELYDRTELGEAHGCDVRALGDRVARASSGTRLALAWAATCGTLGEFTVPRGSN